MGLFLHKFAIGDESLDIRHFSFSKLLNCCSPALLKNKERQDARANAESLHSH